MKTKYPFYYTYLFLSVIVSLLTSCDNNDETYNVVGLWTLSCQDVGTDKSNVTTLMYYELRETIGDIYVQADASGSLRIVAFKSNWMENADSVSIKDGTYTTDGRTITTTIDGISETYTIEDYESVSIRKQYKTHSNAYIRYYFDEIRYNYNIPKELSNYLSIPAERQININNELVGCYQRVGREEYYWFLPDGILRYTFAYYDDSHKNRTLSEEYGTYSFTADKSILTIKLDNISTDYIITFTKWGAQLDVDNNWLAIFPVDNDNKYYDCEYFQ